jgi:glycosyltransferase involved in cell wall biosynthesis
MTIVEALCAGTIVIASNLGGIPEIIEHKINGLLFEAGNERDLISLIDEVNHQPAYIESLSANARSKYLDHYSPQRNYFLLMAIYNRALSSRTKQAHNEIRNPLHQLNSSKALGHYRKRRRNQDISM